MSSGISLGLANSLFAPVSIEEKFQVYRVPGARQVSLSDYVNGIGNATSNLTTNGTVVDRGVVEIDGKPGRKFRMYNQAGFARVEFALGSPIDLSAYQWVRVKLTNHDSVAQPIRVQLTSNAASSFSGSDANALWYQYQIGPNKTLEVVIPIMTTVYTTTQKSPPRPQFSDNPTLWGEATSYGGTLARTAAGWNPATVYSLKIAYATNASTPTHGVEQYGLLSVSEMYAVAQEPTLLIDSLGQSRIGDWEGKASSEDDLLTIDAAELADLSARTADAGGTDSLTNLGASATWHIAADGAGRSWFVSPSGKPMFAWGVTSVNPTNSTGGQMLFGISQSGSATFQKYERVPPAATTYHRVFADALSGSAYAVNCNYNFYGYNLSLKWGNTGYLGGNTIGANECLWQTYATERAWRRLLSWGMNCNGWFSDESSPYNFAFPVAVYNNAGLPSVRKFDLNLVSPSAATVTAMSVSAFGGASSVRPVDPYDTNYRTQVTNAVAAWILTLPAAWRSNPGRYVLAIACQNEPAFGYTSGTTNTANRFALALGILTSVSAVPAKIAMVEYLKTRYATIGDLNAAWNAGSAVSPAFAYTSFDTGGDATSLLATTTTRTLTDATAIQTNVTPYAVGTSYAPSTTFGQDMDLVMKNYATKLGTEFRAGATAGGWDGLTTVKLVADWCPDKVLEGLDAGFDFLSYDSYVYAVQSAAATGGSLTATYLARFNNASMTNGRWMIGEFGFSNVGWGGWGTGLGNNYAEGFQDQAEQTAAFAALCAQQPRCLGLFYYKYYTQAPVSYISGSFGSATSNFTENYNMGFVNVVDEPNPALVQASRWFGANKYAIRTGGAYTAFAYSA